MNPRDLPEVVAELIIEMHEVRSEINALNGRVDRLEQTVVTGFRELREEQRGMREEQRGMRKDIQALPAQIGAAVFQALAPYLDKILDHNDQLKNHEQRLGTLEDPSAQ